MDDDNDNYDAGAVARQDFAEHVADAQREFERAILTALEAYTCGTADQEATVDAIFDAKDCCEETCLRAGLVYHME